MHNRCPAVRFPRAHEEVKLTDVFSRDSDRITFFAKKVNCGEREFNNVRVSVSLANITIGEERLELETVGTVSANADVITLPREAMGMGDVKFLAGIGAFLGWGGALFTIFASSLIGGLIGLTLVAVGNRGWGRRLPYGPYLALGALVWVFGGSGLLNWYIQFLRG
jgi:leader peptidase (prepilin peptidase)/N-methyltransferase